MIEIINSYHIKCDCCGKDVALSNTICQGSIDNAIANVLSMGWKKCSMGNHFCPDCAATDTCQCSECDGCKAKCNLPSQTKTE